MEEEPEINHNLHTVNEYNNKIITQIRVRGQIYLVYIYEF